MNQQTNQPVRDHDARRGKRTAPATPPEYRTLTPDEMKQIDALLGRTGPTLIRREESPERPAQRPRIASTLIVLLILAEVVATALYLFR